MKRFLSILLASLLVLSTVSFTVSADVEFGLNVGTKREALAENPFAVAGRKVMFNIPTLADGQTVKYFNGETEVTPAEGLIAGTVALTVNAGENRFTAKIYNGADLVSTSPVVNVYGVSPSVGGTTYGYGSDTNANYSTFKDAVVDTSTIADETLKAALEADGRTDITTGAGDQALVNDGLLTTYLSYSEHSQDVFWDGTTPAARPYIFYHRASSSDRCVFGMASDGELYANPGVGDANMNPPATARTGVMMPVNTWVNFKMDHYYETGAYDVYMNDILIVKNALSNKGKFTSYYFRNNQFASGVMYYNRRFINVDAKLAANPALILDVSESDVGEVSVTKRDLPENTTVYIYKNGVKGEAIDFAGADTVTLTLTGEGETVIYAQAEYDDGSVALGMYGTVKSADATIPFPGEPGGNEPGGNEPGGNEPGGNEPGGNEPGGNEPGGNEPGGNEPGGNEPGGNEPGGNEPGGNEPGGNEPGGNEPGGNEPGGNEPGGNEPGGNEPGGNEPGGNEPVVAPTLSLSVVDNSGNPVAALNPGMNAYLRVKTSGLETFYTMAANITATGATFGIASDIKDRFAETPALSGGIYEIDKVYGVMPAESTMYFPITQTGTGTYPVTVSEFVAADIPFTVTAAAGADVKFDIAAENTELKTGKLATTKYTVGGTTRNLATNNYSSTVQAVTAVPEITDVSISPALPVIALGQAFSGFEGYKIVATHADGTREYDIVTDAPAEGKAYIDISGLNVDSAGLYKFKVKILDGGIKNGGFEKADAVELLVSNEAAKTNKVVADTTKVVEVKYGASIDQVKEAIVARNDLFKDIMTDDSQIPGTYTVAAANISAESFVGTTTGEQTVTVTAIDGVTVESGAIRVNVKNPTIIKVELSPEWVAEPAKPEGTEFPGFGAKVIKATYDADTSFVESEEFAIVTGSVESEKAYVDSYNYKAHIPGDYQFPVVIKSAKLAEDYNGVVTVKVTPAEVVSGKVKLSGNPIVVNFVEGEEAAKAAAEAAVLAADELFYTIMTDGKMGAVAEGVKATAVTSEYNQADNQVIVTVTTVSNAATIEGDATVVVILGELPVISSAKFVDAEGIDVTPSIKAAIAELEEDPTKLAMDWSQYKVKATYPNPLNAEESLEVVYDFIEGEGKGFKVEGWKDFAECGEVGPQNVTVKIYDASKKNEEGVAYTATLAAEITEADPAGLVAVKADSEVKVSYNTSVADAIEEVKDEKGLFVELYKDGSTKASTAKAAEVVIAGYKPTVSGDYEAAIIAIDDAEKAFVPGVITVVVRARNFNKTPAGTQTGGGGVVTVVTPAPGTTEPGTTEPGTTEPGTTEPVENVEFGDVPAGHWAKDVISKLASKGIVSGDSSKNVRPSENITREEAAKIVAVAAKLSGDAGLNFTDADSISDWAEQYVRSAVAGGAFTGNADGTFAPKANITREQFAAIVIRAFGFGEGTNPLTFTDASTIGWSKGYVSKAVELDIVNGYNDNTFRPTQNVTRAEAFAMLSRALDLKEAIDAATAEAEKAEADKKAEEEAKKAAEEAAKKAEEDKKKEETAKKEETFAPIVNTGSTTTAANRDVNGDGVIDEFDVVTE